MTMAAIGLFYGSSTGRTQNVAEQIAAEFGPGEVDLHDVRKATVDDLAGYEVLILGTSTWHWGGLQDEWAIFEDELLAEHLKGKKVALFGLGDQKHYGDCFADGVGHLAARVRSLGAEVVGAWPTDDYDFAHSAAVEDGHFVGLVLDEDNQPDRTAERIRSWVRQLRDELAS
jgi:flavodoxin I